MNQVSLKAAKCLVHVNNDKNMCTVRDEERQGLGLQLESNPLRLWVTGGTDDAMLICPGHGSRWAEASFMAVLWCPCLTVSPDTFSSWQKPDSTK